MNSEKGWDNIDCSYGQSTNNLVGFCGVIWADHKLINIYICIFWPAELIHISYLANLYHTLQTYIIPCKLGTSHTHTHTHTRLVLYWQYPKTRHHKTHLLRGFFQSVTCCIEDDGVWQVIYIIKMNSESNTITKKLINKITAEIC